MQKDFELKDVPMNYDYAEFDNLIIKLAYVTIKDKPELEIFENTEKAKEKEWAIYGFLDNDIENEENVEYLKFGNTEESQNFELAGEKYEIKYLDTGYDEVTYPKFPEKLEKEYFYKFRINKKPESWK